MRRQDRQLTDAADLKAILEKSDTLSLAMQDDEYPYLVQLHYGTEWDGEGPIVLYAHSAKEGHKLDCLAKDPHIVVFIHNSVELIEAEVPCAYGSKFESLFGRGTGEVVTDLEEKTHALKLLMRSVAHKEFEFDEKMVNSVAVIKMTLTEYTAKAHR